MSNYGYTNEAGEPIMDAAAYRFEQYLDSTFEPDPDSFYDRWDDEPDYIDPSECDHADKSWRGFHVECDSGCEAEGIAIVKPDFDETEVDDFIIWSI